MNWPRARRWIGEHPILAVTAWSFAVIGAVVAVELVAENVRGRTQSWWWSPADALTIAALVLGGLAVAGFACWVGLVRARAGLSVARIAVAALYLWFIVPVTTVLAPLVRRPGDGFDFLPVIIIMGGIILFGGAGGCVLVGAAAAAAISRWMIRRGKWEVTMPLKEEE